MTDEEQIRNVLGDFCHHLDNREFRSMSNLFAADGVFAGGTGDHRGPAAIYEWISAGTLAQDPTLRRRHVASNPIIDVRGDTADVVSDLIMFECVAKANWTVRVGRYTDRLIRGNDGWRFLRRHLEWL